MKRVVSYFFMFSFYQTLLKTCGVLLSLSIKYVRIALLRYNFHAILFMHVKCSIVFSVFAELCGHHHNQF